MHRKLEELRRRIGILGVGGKGRADLTMPRDGVSEMRPGAGREARKINVFDMDNPDELGGLFGELRQGS